MQMIIHIESKAEMRRRLGLLNTSQVARLIGVEKDVLFAGQRKGRIIIPTTKLGGGPRRYYRSDEIQVVRAACIADGYIS